MHLENKLKVVLVGIFIMLCEAESIKFERNVVAVGPPYFKIVMTLGECRDHILFKEQKVWGAVSLNQVMDIYYSSKDKNIKVSLVEIIMVINNTNVFATSETGVESSDFSATIFIPIRVGVILYQLIVFSCNRPHTENIYNSASLEEMTKIPHKNLKQYEDDEDDFTDGQYGLEPLMLKQNKTDAKTL